MSERDPLMRVQDMASVTRDALAQGLWDGDRAALFHDLNRLRNRVGRLTAAFPDTTLHAIAIKANPLVEVLRAAVQVGAGLEAASIEEVHLALAAGCEASKIVYDGPAKTRAELAEVARLGIHVNVDNFDELARVEPGRATWGLRVNPAGDSGDIQLTTASGRSAKFGVSFGAAHERDAVLDAFAANPWLSTLHSHVGSQGYGIDRLVEAVGSVVTLRDWINRRLGRQQITTIDIGGGLPARHCADRQEPTIGEYTAALRSKVREFDQTRWITEFGRSVQASCGWAVSRVEYVKSIDQQRFAVIHVGGDFLMRPVYHPSDWYHDMVVLDADGHPKSGTPRPWTVGGPLCFGGDIIARDRSLPDIEAGDLLLIRDTGAYTLSLWSRHCSRGIPIVLGRDGDSLCVLREAEQPADVVSLWSRDR